MPSYYVSLWIIGWINMLLDDMPANEMVNMKVFLFILKRIKRWDIIDRYILKHRIGKSFTKRQLEY